MGLLGDAVNGGSPSLGAPPAARARLAELLHGLPPTGRVPVAQADGRWLEANPARDPVLRSGHEVVLPRRPRTVTVITGAGERCTPVHTPGREAAAYVAACDAAGASRTDWAWIAQPDGRVQRSGMATWNRQRLEEPAPGAWIWAPRRDAG